MPRDKFAAMAQRANMANANPTETASGTSAEGSPPQQPQQPQQPHSQQQPQPQQQQQPQQPQTVAPQAAAGPPKRDKMAALAARQQTQQQAAGTSVASVPAPATTTTATTTTATATATTLVAPLPKRDKMAALAARSMVPPTSSSSSTTTNITTDGASVATNHNPQPQQQQQPQPQPQPQCGGDDNDDDDKGNIPATAVTSPRNPSADTTNTVELTKNSTGSQIDSNENTTGSREETEAMDGDVESKTEPKNMPPPADAKNDIHSKNNSDTNSNENENENEAVSLEEKEATDDPNGKGGDNFSDAFVSIKRSKSAMQTMRVPADCVEAENFKPLPNGDCGDGVTNPYDNEEVPDKFWSQRRRLFTLFDNGIRLDKESWYSVTPEAIANHIGAHLLSNRENAIVLDPFCGCGGNAIAFARMEEVKLVVCIDKDHDKLKMAASNAAVYKIPTEKMVFIHDNAARILSLYKNKTIATTTEPAEGNAAKSPETSPEGFRIGGIELLPEAIDCVFLSPPWGGIDYGKVGKRNYTLKCINIDGIEENTQMDGESILKRAADALGQDGPIALFLPRNINGVALGRSVLRAGYDCPMVLEKNVLNGKLKTVTAYIGL
eukprot:CAMPEP_0172409688 /NCGR_PEP_ID=MMETSP1061-20121228/76494_1 /TAXON_ID=37318 /ORGANISM="Pseudo-nitzschia pungens, Strain cf. pungens" /LENGTH=608 /DNA_ID=CAMNT_0013145849 /DNA_START=79 /DNA_END=1905 /DNA_ORIENTATION=+